MAVSPTDAVTTAGVVFVAYQLRQAQLELRASFEQTFSDRYDRIVAQIPLPVLLGGQPDLDDIEQLRAFFDYFELCEEEMYYRQRGRIGDRTWSDWREGISLHCRREGFMAAWQRLTGDEIDPPPSNNVRQTQFTLLRSAIDALQTGRPFDPKTTVLRRQRS
jgi:hypothetical protein